ncbi:uncharacterized protein LOC142534840 isoform X1 [Primulina tabacum]|uniref:uncharacterized protein LOC142534840 isoform X1 n=1 Tax=Primulina tabacum TaxID=48773 RepID=UPI003F59B1EF
MADVVCNPKPSNRAMQSPFVGAFSTIHHLQLLGTCTKSSSSRRRYRAYPCLSCNYNDQSSVWSEDLWTRLRPRGEFKVGCKREKVNTKGKENVWSVDNEMAKVEKGKERSRRRKSKEGKRVRNVNRKGDRVMVSASMLMEVETILQTQEPVILPAWNTFTSSVSGIWKGVGAVFSPITAKMEPIDIGRRNENLFDCYTMSRLDVVPSTSGTRKSHIQRKINWVTLNPFGEAQQSGSGVGYKDEDASVGKLNVCFLPKFDSFDLGSSDVMEEDVMGMEPGLVFFEDGSYSRGPVDIPIGGLDESNYYLSPTFKFEQCLVKGCHNRLRVVHTIEFSDSGSDIQIMRVAVYEEKWVSPANISDSSGPELDLMPFSQRKRVHPSQLTGSWKVFEISATPIYNEEIPIQETNDMPYVYLCMENLKKRTSPENLVYFGEEEMMDMQDVAVLWLPGGITAYVDVKEDGILCIGVGWYSDEGINLVMERDYGMDGKFKEVRWKSEMKRRWSNLPLT